MAPSPRITTRPPGSPADNRSSMDTPAAANTARLAPKAAKDRATKAAKCAGSKEAVKQRSSGAAAHAQHAHPPAAALGSSRQGAKTHAVPASQSGEPSVKEQPGGTNTAASHPLAGSGQATGRVREQDGSGGTLPPARTLRSPYGGAQLGDGTEGSKPEATDRAIRSPLVWPDANLHPSPVFSVGPGGASAKALHRTPRLHLLFSSSDNGRQWSNVVQAEWSTLPRFHPPRRD
jgi:hypothetical protein